MIITDWRDLSPELVAPLYEEQARAWADTLGWDLSASWTVVERARAAGALPGLVSRRPDGAITGWTFFLRQDQVLQIGVLTGDGAGTVRELLEGILDSPEAASARELTCLLYPARPNALSALSRRRFALQPQRYLGRALDASCGSPDQVIVPASLKARKWLPEDAVGCVRLLARAYGHEKHGRVLAPHGTLAEWAHYLGQIVRTPACGTLSPRASFVIEEAETGAPVGFVLTTIVGESTAHIAQLAVDPASARRGVGRALLQMAARAAASIRMTRLTLLVFGDNDGASHLYSSEGLEPIGEFVFASRLMPVRRQTQRAA